MRMGTAALLSFGAAVVVSAEFVIIGLIPAMAAKFRLAASEVGWLVTLFALASALLGPILVAATTRLQPTKVMAAALLPFAANLMLLAFPRFEVVVMLRVLQGAALPLFMSLAAAQLAAARGAGRGVALLYIGVTIGGTLAPPFGAFAASRFSWETPMAMIGALALALAPAAACLAFRRLESVDEQDSPWRLLTAPSVGAHLLLSALLFAAMFTGFSYIALLLQHAGLDNDAVTAALLGFGVASLGGNWLAGLLARWALPASQGIVLAIVAAVACLSIAGKGDMVIGAAILIWGAAHAASFVFCQVRLMAVIPEAPGFAGALNISAANVGIAIGSFAGGHAIALSGFTALAFTTFVLGLFSMMLVYWIVRRRCLAG